MSLFSASNHIYHEVSPDTFVRWNGEPIKTSIQRNVPILDNEGNPVLDENNQPEFTVETYEDDVRHGAPAVLLAHWTAQEMADVGLFVPIDDEVIPDDKVSTGITVQRISGVVKYVHTLEDLPEPTADMVDRERDRRIEAGFMFGGKLFQSRVQDQKRISGAGTLALGAMVVLGAQAGNYRWHGGTEDFIWIAADNTTMVMDAQTMFTFGQAAAAWESQHVHAARALKDADPVPHDYMDDAYWPAVAV